MGESSGNPGGMADLDTKATEMYHISEAVLLLHSPEAFLGGFQTKKPTPFPGSRAKKVLGLRGPHVPPVFQPL